MTTYNQIRLTLSNVKGVGSFIRTDSSTLSTPSVVAATARTVAAYLSYYSDFSISGLSAYGSIYSRRVG